MCVCALFQSQNWQRELIKNVCYLTNCIFERTKYILGVPILHGGNYRLYSEYSTANIIYVHCTVLWFNSIFVYRKIRKHIRGTV